MNTRALTAEFIGTFALILLGAGAGALGIGGLVGVALAHGLCVLAFAYAYGDISGTHINPAVTAGLLAAKKIDVQTAVGYWIAQLAGGTLGAFVLAWLVSGLDAATFPGAAGLGATTLATGVTPAMGVVLEAILTFFLVNSVLHAAVAGKAGNLAGVAIGLTLVACILMGGPLTGASLNPARTIGPAIASGNYADLWVYIVGPVLGAVAAALLYTGLLGEEG